MLKKLALTVAASAALAFTSNAQFVRGDTRSDVISFLRGYYSSTQYTLCTNGDISFTEGGNYYLWKFDSQYRISYLYVWYKSSDDDRDERSDLNRTDYYHYSENVWYKYRSNGSKDEIVTYGNYSVPFCDGNTWSRNGAWKFDYYY